VSVSTSGLITAQAPGNAIISATHQGRTGTLAAWVTGGLAYRARVEVIEVIDGDTLRIKNGPVEQVRVIGFDAPERAIEPSERYPTKDQDVWCVTGEDGRRMGEEARRFVESWLGFPQTSVPVELDVPTNPEFDGNNRLLAYLVFHGRSLTDEMLSSGLGNLYIEQYPARGGGRFTNIDPSRARQLELLEGEAKSQRRGFWGSWAGLTGNWPERCPVDRLTINGSAAFSAVGQSSQLIATAHLMTGDRLDVTSAAAWHTSNPSVASVSNGVVTALSSGSATITANYQGKSAIVTATVSGGAARCDFALSPSAQSVSAAGGTFSFTATGSASSCAWTASTTTSWLTLTGPVSGSQSPATIPYSVAANQTNNGRTGSISVSYVDGIRQFTVTQSGSASQVLGTYSFDAGPFMTSVTGFLVVPAGGCREGVLFTNVTDFLNACQVPLLRSHVFATGDVGRTYYVDSTTDSQFSTFAGFLTNGNSRDIWIVEANPSNGNFGAQIAIGLDFPGSTISRIGVRIDSLSTSPTGGRVAATLIVEGSR
jgi:endonuclease YncB( thermonuclease family)